MWFSQSLLQRLPVIMTYQYRFVIFPRSIPPDITPLSLSLPPLLPPSLRPHAFSYYLLPTLFVNVILILPTAIVFIGIVFVGIVVGGGDGGGGGGGAGGGAQCTSMKHHWSSPSLVNKSFFFIIPPFNPYPKALTSSRWRVEGEENIASSDVPSCRHATQQWDASP